MNILLSSSLIVLFLLVSCDGKNIEDEKELLEALKKANGPNTKHILISKEDIHFITECPFDSIQNRVSSNIYCSKCDNPGSHILVRDRYLNLDEICIGFKGPCLACRDTLIGCFAVHHKLDRVKMVLNK